MKKITVHSPAEMNLQLVGLSLALLFCLAVFVIGGYLSIDGTRLFLIVEQGMQATEAMLLSAFLSLMIVAIAASANVVSKWLAPLLIALSFAIAGLSAFSIYSGKTTNVTGTVKAEREASPQYKQLNAEIVRLQNKLKSFTTRSAAIDQQLTQALTNSQTLNRSIAQIGSEKCSGKYSTRCHNQKQETLRRMRKNKAADQTVINSLKSDRTALNTEETATRLTLTTQQENLSRYNKKTQLLALDQQKNKLSITLIWSVLPDFSTALMSALMGKILFAMLLIVREKQLLQEAITRKTSLVSAYQTLVNDDSGLVIPVETEAVPDTVLNKLVAQQSHPDLDPIQAEAEYRQCVDKGIAPLTVTDAKKRFPALSYEIFRAVWEESFCQQKLNRSMRFKADGRLHQCRYSYPAPGEKGGIETTSGKNPQAESWQSEDYHKRAQLSLVK